ncbi:MAG: hypothetical protein Q8M92_04785 [Candidatus Subteraquimicrobiales bacterium]|nr:hypothetical protein [Candidatus Subteraquimicrobiales bacterium]
MKEDHVRMFVRGYLEADDVEFFDMGEKRMVNITMRDTAGLQSFTSSFKLLRDIMEIDVEKLSIVMDRDDFESLLFSSLLQAKANDILSGGVGLK